MAHSLSIVLSWGRAAGFVAGECLLSAQLLPYCSVFAIQTGGERCQFECSLVYRGKSHSVAVRGPGRGGWGLNIILFRGKQIVPEVDFSGFARVKSGRSLLLFTLREATETRVCFVFNLPRGSQTLRRNERSKVVLG